MMTDTEFGVLLLLLAFGLGVVVGIGCGGQGGAPFGTGAAGGNAGEVSPPSRGPGGAGGASSGGAPGAGGASSGGAPGAGGAACIDVTSSAPLRLGPSCPFGAALCGCTLDGAPWFGCIMGAAFNCCARDGNDSCAIYCERCP